MTESLSSIAFDSLTAAEDAVTLSMLGMGGCAFQVIGTYSGTITFEGTVDLGNWVSMKVVSLGGTASATTTTSTGVFIGTCAGLAGVRARMSSYASGSAQVTIRAVESTPSAAFLT